MKGCEGVGTCNESLFIQDGSMLVVHGTFQYFFFFNSNGNGKSEFP